MPSDTYYRAQAQLFAKLALAATDPDVVARYNLMALEHLAKAGDVEPGAGATQPPADGRPDVNRD